MTKKTLNTQAQPAKSNEESTSERMADNPWHDYIFLTKHGWVYENGQYIKKSKPSK